MAIIAIPLTSPAPNPNQIFSLPTSTQSMAPQPPEATPLPPGQSPIKLLKHSSTTSSTDIAPETTTKPLHFHKPTLRLEIRDLSHPGAVKFLTAINAAPVLERAVSNVQHLLYHPDGLPTSTSAASSTTTITPLPTPAVTTAIPHHPHAPIPTPTVKPIPQLHCPPTRSVTVVLRDVPGVAYTTGTELDPKHHKEIHLSLGYVDGIARERLGDEITGVLTHELVHCYQWTGRDSCPGGLIEGVADWVRLRCGLSPPHWKREVGPKDGKDGDKGKDGKDDKEKDKYKWDRGYQHTAYFLEYLEKRFGKGTVRRLNEGLRKEKYYEKSFWHDHLGRDVEKLWEEYVKAVRDGDVVCS